MVSLRCAYNHVFDKVSVSSRINDGHIKFLGLEFPQGNISSDISFMFSFQFIQDPITLEGAPSHLSNLLLKFFY
ncbi:unnamed protein product [Gulo gulo]|uniref:Uncharacterized protein n=1 Tax=Gulo gulo TaxID=48420 RepID=A0A9X9LLN0_GULGU|nr:unnamed protein product [Gulo gulo]